MGNAEILKHTTPKIKTRPQRGTARGDATGNRNFKAYNTKNKDPTPRGDVKTRLQRGIKVFLVVKLKRI
ncbi:MAG: hypothetical protein J7K01_02245 [Thermovirga sp.]|nr:hypothetical protein [Thermovirga sp.]